MNFTISFNVYNVSFTYLSKPMQCIKCIANIRYSVLYTNKKQHIVHKELRNVFYNIIHTYNLFITILILIKCLNKRVCV